MAFIHRDGFDIDTNSTTYRWVLFRLDAEVANISKSLCRDLDEKTTHRLRGMYELCAKLTKELQKIENS